MSFFSAYPSLTQATPEQQRVLERIAAQRARVRARRAARLEAQAQARAEAAEGVNPEAPFVQRAAAFAKLHPGVVAAALGSVVAAAGPRRFVRWAAVVLPLLLRMRR